MDQDILPESIRHNPAFLEWRITDLETRVTSLEQPDDDGIKTPVGTLPLPVAVAVGAWLLYMHPDKLWKLLGL